MKDASANVLGADTDLEDDGMKFEFSQSLTPTAAIARAIAEQTGSDPNDGPPLHDFVETDALNVLLTESNGNLDAISVSFTYDGYSVYVDGSGRVVVDPDSE